MDQSELLSLPPEQRRELLAKLLREQAFALERFPMSAGQQGLWHAFRRDPELTTFNVFLPTRIRDPFQPEALRLAINLISSRHAALRTTFTDESGELRQIVHGRLDPVFSVTEMIGATDEEIRQRATRETLVPFDLTKGPLLRIAVYKLADDDWIILALTHHIIVDFWSLILIVSELRQAYPQYAAGHTPQLPPAIDNYRQFVSEQSQVLSGPTGTRLANFWKRNIESVPVLLELPLDKPRPATFTHRAEYLQVKLSPDVARRASDLASHCRATPFAVMHSAVQILLQRYCRQNEFFIGSPFLGRLHQNYEQTVGFFINMLPMKSTIQPGMTFVQLIQQTTDRLLDALEHEAFPIGEIVRLSSISRDPSRSPLFQVSCTFERAQKREELGRASFLFPDHHVVFQFGGLHQENFFIPHSTCHYDLEFVFEQSNDGIQALLIYCQDLFAADSMQYLARNFAAMVDCLLDNSTLPLDQLAWPSTLLTQQLEQVENSPRRPQPQSAAPERPRQISAAAVHLESIDGSNLAATVHEQILRSAVANPDVLALKTPTTQLSYRELVAGARSLSQQLLARGVKSEQLVPVVCRSGANAFIGMLAVHLAGAAAVPIDICQPSVALPQLALLTGACCVLTDAIDELSQSIEQQLLIPLVSDQNIVATIGDNYLAPEVTPQNLAYMVYTSGSTGASKGVLIEHQNICNTLNWRRRVLTLNATDRVLMLLSHQFDAALGIGWSCLTQGATIVWPDEQVKRDPVQLIDTLQRESITVLPAVPSMLRVLAANPQLSQCRLRQVWSGGEAIPADLPSQIRSRTKATFWNLYGPTEAAVEATAIEISEHSPNDLMTVGYPIDGVDVVVLDANQQLVPCTVPGELAIAGAGLARGYYNDEKLTASKFIVDPRDRSQRLYLTGDLGRVLADGRVVFLGRDDHQVKLRGYRIELGEIEATMQLHPSVDRAAVIVDGQGTPAAQLVAYVNSVATEPLDFEALRVFLMKRLAPYKVPSAIVQVDVMPLTSSGKVDRKRLPQQIPHESWLSNLVQPRNDLERFLADAWCAELNLPSIGIHQNFFEVGGSSLKAAMLTTQLSQQLQIHVPTALLFDLADIAQLAERLATLHPQVLSDRFGYDCISFYERAAGASSTAPHPLLAPLKTSGHLPPIFMVHPPGGIVVCYRELARFLPTSQPLWAIRSRGLHGQEQLPESIEQMAADYLQAIQTVQPQGPYTIGGWSLGGLVAFEMAKQLRIAGQHVRLVFLDTTIPEGAAACVPQEEQVNVGLEYGIELTLEQLGQLSPEEQLPMLHTHADKLGILTEQSPPEVIQQVLQDLQNLFHHHVSLAQNYRLTPIDARLLLLRPEQVPFELKVTEDRGWRHLLPNVDVKFVPGHHHSMVQAPQVQRLAEVISQSLG